MCNNAVNTKVTDEKFFYVIRLTDITKILGQILIFMIAIYFLGKKNLSGQLELLDTTCIFMFMSCSVFKIYFD